jgi:hypothetical protein
VAFLTTINTGFFLFTLVDTEHLCHKFLSSNFGYFKSFFCISNFHFLFLSSSSGIHICYITYIKIYMLENLIFNISLVFVLIFYYLSSLFFFFFFFKQASNCDPPTAAFHVVVITGTYIHTWLFFEMRELLILTNYYWLKFNLITLSSIIEFFCTWAIKFIL